MEVGIVCCISALIEPRYVNKVPFCLILTVSLLDKVGEGSAFNKRILELGIGLVRKRS